MENQFKMYRELIGLRNKAKKSKDLNYVISIVNKIVTMHKDHLNKVHKKETKKDFTNVLGKDFNDWAYDTQNYIEIIYKDVKDYYYELHFEKYQFNAYNI